VFEMMSWLSPRVFSGWARALAAVGVNTAVPEEGVNWRLPKLKEVITRVSA
jgi:hypothetical protein